MTASLFGYVSRWAQERPEEPAIVSVDARLSWRELDDTARRIATVLNSRGLVPGMRIGLRLPFFLEAVAILGAWSAGVATVSLPPEPAGAPAQPGLDAVLVERAEGASGDTVEIVCDASFVATLATVQPAPEELSVPDDIPLHTLFSSGTTGTPKPVTFTAGEVEERTRSALRHWIVDRPFMCLIGLPAVAGFQTFVSSLLTGEPYLVPGEMNGNISLIAGMNVKAVKASPHQWGQFVRVAMSRGLAVPQISRAVSAGSPLPPLLARQVSGATGADVLNVYGSSEAGTVAVGIVGEVPEAATGRIVDDIQIQVVDDNGTMCAEGHSGLLRVKRRAGDSDWFSPGDRGRIMAGMLFVEGRHGDVMNLAGVKINPVDVESRLSGIANVEDVGVVGIVDRNGVSRVAVAYVASPQGSGGSPVAHLARETQSILGEANEAVLVEVTGIPRTAQGKLQRDALRNLVLTILE